MASYEVLTDEEERGRIITADSAKFALVQALAEAFGGCCGAIGPKMPAPVRSVWLKGE